MLSIVNLHTRVIFPKDYEEGQKLTALLDRSPYGYTSLEWMVDLFLPYGFVTIGQDMRGTPKSEGNFSIWHSDANDSQDLGDWIVAQEWSNGKVFSFGASADGLASFTMPENNPSWLDSQYVVWSSSLGYEVIFPNGAYLEALADMWIRGTVPDQADECLALIEANEMRTTWWDPLDLTGKYNLVHATSGFWAGWYDIFLVGNLAAYQGYNYESQDSVKFSSRITIDPLGHCQDAAEYFPQDLIYGRTLLGKFSLLLPLPLQLMLTMASMLSQLWLKLMRPMVSVQSSEQTSRT
jgi:predicted acyl esterase